MAQHRSIPPRLSLPPPHPFTRQLSNSARYYPSFTPTSKSSFIFSPSPTPTPSKRPRAPEGPIWLFTLLQLIPLYALHSWLSTSATPIPLALVSFLVLLGSALFLNILYGSWKGRALLSSQWGLLVVNGALVAVSCLLRFEGLRHCGPLETIFAEFAGGLAAKVFLDPSNKSSNTARKFRGIAALLLGIFLLSQGWSRASCSPLAIDIGYRARSTIINEPRDCVKTWLILAPTLGGVFSASQRLIGARASLKTIGKKRVQVISFAMGALLLCPLAILQALVAGQSHWHLRSLLWPLSFAVAFGTVISFFGDFYSEEKLLRPVHSLKAFQILTCCVCASELLFGLDISLVGFLFCNLVIMIGVQGLAFLAGQLSWESLGDMDDSSLIYASWVKGPLMHVMSDKKSRKIAIFLLINTGFMVVEFFYGFLSNSLGLISDACHMLFDCAALAIGLYASYISRLPENSRFNYGYGRFEVVSGFGNAVLLVLIASLIVLESIERILEPPEISTESLLLVSVGGLLVNIVGLIFFHEEHHHAHGGGDTCSHSHPIHKGANVSKEGLLINAMKVDHLGGTHGHTHDQVALLAAIDDTGLVHRHNDLKGYHEVHEHLPVVHQVQPDKHQNDQMLQHVDYGHHSNDNNDSMHYPPVHSVCNSHGHDHCQEFSHGLDNTSLQQDHHDHSHSYNNDNVAAHGHVHDHDHDHDHCSDNHSWDHGHVQNHHNHNHDHEGPDSPIHDHDQDHGHHHHDHNHQHHHMDHNMYGIFLHVLADTLGSVGVVISTILIKYKGWLITDPACSIFLSALIIASVIPLIRNSAEILLQRVPRYNEGKLKAALKGVSRITGVRNMQQVHIWSYTNTSTVGSLYLQISAGSNKMKIRELALKLLQDAGISDLTLQIEEI